MTSKIQMIVVFHHMFPQKRLF
ncbi:hypothetical protein Godav_010116 [Gossypium davidsonii]|uniref:Uncharacterized protein n=2 Tax=Gossypium TaxID=3633 RepID=A0A7J8SH57_GOSDV|nr:hypothetical protein [Gossypium davidsonii]MBA0624832.1 hypothetical protein [Gossypium davidsonii]MBA0660402.1 hypothetical protein [Gossypium klotzschianum]MBA0660403.1 hypothetical protein [Gossypium klotzschianum]